MLRVGDYIKIDLGSKNERTRVSLIVRDQDTRYVLTVSFVSVPPGARVSFLNSETDAWQRCGEYVRDYGESSASGLLILIKLVDELDVDPTYPTYPALSLDAHNLSGKLTKNHQLRNVLGNPGYISYDGELVELSPTSSLAINVDVIVSEKEMVTIESALKFDLHGEHSEKIYKFSEPGAPILCRCENGKQMLAVAVANDDHSLLAIPVLAPSHNDSLKYMIYPTDRITELSYCGNLEQALSISKLISVAPENEGISKWENI